MTHVSHVEYQRLVTFWRRARALTALLLGVWLLVTLAAIFFARELDGVTLFGWPLPFFMAAQGLTLFYVALVGFFTWRMQRLERLLKESPHHAE